MEKGIFIIPEHLDDQKKDLPSDHKNFEAVKDLLNIPNFPLITWSVVSVGGGAETHTHPHDLAYFIVSGSAKIRIGEEEHILGPGCLAYVPPNVPHANWNAGREPCVVLGIHGPHDSEFDKTYYGDSYMVAFNKK